MTLTAKTFPIISIISHIRQDLTSCSAFITPISLQRAENNMQMPMAGK